MAFQQLSNPASIDAILSTLSSFMVANAGFTAETSMTGVTSGHLTNQTMIRLSKTVDSTTMYYHFVPRQFSSPNNAISDFFSIVAYMGFSLGTTSGLSGTRNSDSPSNTPADAVEYPSQAYLYRTSTSFTNAFYFTDGNIVNLVVEVTPGIFTHLNFGNLTKLVPFTGGEFMNDCSPSADNLGQFIYGSNDRFPFVSSRANTSDRSDYAVRWNTGQTNERSEFKTSRESSNQFLRIVHWPLDWIEDDENAEFYPYHSFRAFTPNAGTLTSPLFPLYLRMKESATTDSPYFLFGYANNVRYVNVDQLEPGQEITFNTQTWKIFPLGQKDGSNLSGPITNDIGFAYLM